MGVNFSTLVYLPCFDLFGRPVIFRPAGRQAFTGRGIYDSRSLDVIAEDGSIVSDQTTILDIRASEFAVLPEQNDTITIPVDPEAGLPAIGDFQIVDASHNGGGEVTLTLRRIVT